MPIDTLKQWIAYCTHYVELWPSTSCVKPRL